MSHDIEAAARGLLDSFRWQPGYGDNYLIPRERIDALRSALAHAARGEGEAKCGTCGSEDPRRRNDCYPGVQRTTIGPCDDETFHATPPPATGEAERCEDHGREGCIDCEPATGEAGTRGEVEKARAAFYEAARKVRLAQLRWGEHLEQHGEPGEDSACTCHANLRGSELAFDESYDALLAAEARALPEAREGGRSVP